MKGAKVRRVAVYYVDRQTMKTRRILGTHLFTCYGERYAVTKRQYAGATGYGITHIDTGRCMGSISAITRDKAKTAGIRKLRQLGRTKCVRGFKKIRAENEANPWMKPAVPQAALSAVFGKGGKP